MYTLRAGRDLGASFAGQLEYTHVTAPPTGGGMNPGGRGRSNAVGATASYSYLVAELPICTVAELRHGRASTSYRYHGGGYFDEWGAWIPTGWATSEHGVASTVGLLGLGTGVEARLATDTYFTPHGNVRIGWVQSRPVSGCGPQGCGYMATGNVQLEGEAGITIRYRRLLAAGGFRASLLEGDPVLQPRTSQPDTPVLVTVAAGVSF